MAKVVAVLVALALVVVAATSAGRASAAKKKCDPDEVRMCKAAVIGAEPPSPTCCSNLRVQRDCFCEYAHDPAYRKYVRSPGAPITLHYCRIPIPNC